MKSSKHIDAFTAFFRESPAVLSLILIAITLFSTLLLYPHAGKINYTYQVGDIAERDIKAPKDFFIEDQEATLENRRKAADTIQFLYDYDPILQEKLSDRITKAFAVPRELYIADPETLEEKTPPFETIRETREAFQTILGITIGKGAYYILYQYDFATDIADKIIFILSEILQNGVVANKELLLKEESKGIVLRTIGSSTEEVVARLKTFYGPDQAKTMVRIIGDSLLKELNYNLNNLIVDICQQMLRPNITMNRNATEERIKAAEKKIKPVLYQIKQGEMILREGERVDAFRLMKLNALSNQMNEKNSIMAQSGLAAIILISLVVFYLVSLRHHPAMEKYHNKNILFLGLMLILFLSVARIALPISSEDVHFTLPLGLSPATLYLALPLAAGAMIVCLFLGFEVAMCFSLILSLLCSIIFSSPIDVFLYILLSSLTGAFWIKECRERKGFITAGLQLAFFNAALALLLNIYSAEPRLEVMSLVKSISLTALGGITSGIITAGLTPVMEIMFGYTTDIKFLELSNLDQPIMRRLMIEAPGTYNHSVIVANLAEAAASAIGANALKTKVCAFYHDIGKLDKPLYFIENQTDGKNRHDKISPSMSALVLIQHTKKGLEYAREYKLGQDIMDTIQQHHGTSLIRYFYNKSIKIHGEDAVKESDFRYPGPKPQTREAGIVMLADVVEAALRTLERPTSARIQGRVQDLINAIFADGQLEECELTLKDLHQIAKSFNKILTGLYHHRIEYDNKPQEAKKEKNGTPEHSNPEPAKNNKPIPPPDKSKDPTNLKRLGI